MRAKMSSGARWRFLPRNPLVVVQIAFSLALLTAAGLFIRGANKAASLETGLAGGKESHARSGREPRRVRFAAGRTALPHAQRSARRAARRAARQHFGDGAVRDGDARPRPFSAPAMHVGKDDKPATAAEGLALARATTASAPTISRPWEFRSCAAALSPIAEATQPNAPAVAIIDEALAKKLWPDGDALGQRIQFAPDGAPRAKRDDGGDNIGIQRAARATSSRKSRSRSSASPAVHARRRDREAPRGTIYIAVRSRLPKQRLFLHSIRVV